MYYKEPVGPTPMGMSPRSYAEALYSAPPTLYPQYFGSPSSMMMHSQWQGQSAYPTGPYHEGYDSTNGLYYAPTGPPSSQFPMDVGRLSEYINPNKTRRMYRAQMAHRYPQGGYFNSYKTVMCQGWLETANCRFGSDCKFAHGEAELRYVRPPIKNPAKYKTRVCEKYVVRGVCPYGTRCLFIHPGEEPQTRVPGISASGCWTGFQSSDSKDYVTALLGSSDPGLPPAAPSLGHSRGVSSSRPSSHQSSTGNGDHVVTTEKGDIHINGNHSAQSSVKAGFGKPTGPSSTTSGAMETKRDENKKQLRSMLKRQDHKSKTGPVCNDITEQEERGRIYPEAAIIVVEEGKEMNGKWTNRKDDKGQQSTELGLTSRSFNESGQQRESLAYTLANVLDLSDS